MGKCKNEVCLLPALKRVKKGYPHGDAPSYLTISNQKMKKGNGFRAILWSKSCKHLLPNQSNLGKHDSGTIYKIRIRADSL